MKNNHCILIISIIIALTALSTSCGTVNKAKANGSAQMGQATTTPVSPTASDPRDAVIATLADWQTMQTGGNIRLSAGSTFSSSIQVRMVRDQAIYISLRPVLGIEVGKLIITADSLYAVDKVHKRYIAEKVSLLTGGIPVTVSDVQNIFLGRPFIIGKGTLSEDTKAYMTVSNEGDSFTLVPGESYKGYGYTFSFNKKNEITSLQIMPQGSATASCQVKYSDVKASAAGNIAHSIDANASIEKKNVAFSLTYKGIDWNGKVRIELGIPSNYKRMSARDLFSMFAN